MAGGAGGLVAGGIGGVSTAGAGLTCAGFTGPLTSSAEISVSSVRLSSRVARRNSPIALPIVFPISGSFLGPKINRARTMMKSSSGIPKDPIMAHSPFPSMIWRLARNVKPAIHYPR